MVITPNLVGTVKGSVAVCWWNVAGSQRRPKHSLFKHCELVTHGRWRKRRASTFPPQKIIDSDRSRIRVSKHGGKNGRKLRGCFVNISFKLAGPKIWTCRRSLRFMRLWSLNSTNKRSFPPGKVSSPKNKRPLLEQKMLENHSNRGYLIDCISGYLETSKDSKKW